MACSLMGEQGDGLREGRKQSCCPWPGVPQTVCHHPFWLLLAHWREFQQVKAATKWCFDASATALRLRASLPVEEGD